MEHPDEYLVGGNTAGLQEKSSLQKVLVVLYQGTTSVVPKMPTI
jgi:hypothetical protein